VSILPKKYNMEKGIFLLLAAFIVLLLAAGYTYLAPLERRPRGVRPRLESVRRGYRTELRVAGLTGGEVPARYTCDGEDVSPPLSWEPVEGAASYALIVYDPDAPKGIFVHWMIYGIPGSVHALPEAVPPVDVTEFGAQGLNSFGRPGYGGPCPPPGPPHHYHFLLLALDAEPSLSPRATVRQFLDAVEGHVVGYGEVVLTYGRG